MNFSLYVTGNRQRNVGIIHNITSVCAKELPDLVDLSVIDILKNPEAAKKEQILVTPTLIKQTPLPRVRFIGDFSNPEKITHLFHQIKLAAKKKQN